MKFPHFMADKKPNRLVTPGLVRLLTNVGITNLSQEQVSEYSLVYESHYGSPKATMLRLAHKVGFTNLSNDQVDRYCDQVNKK